MGESRGPLKQNITRAAVDGWYRNKEKERAGRANTYYCSSCDRCELDERLVTPEELGIIDSAEIVTGVVVADPFCPLCSDVALERKRLCQDGNRDRKNTCVNCAHADRVTCQVKSDNPKTKVYTTLYVCKNTIRAEQYPKGTVMKPYIGCEHHGQR